MLSFSLFSHSLFLIILLIIEPIINATNVPVNVITLKGMDKSGRGMKTRELLPMYTFPSKINIGEGKSNPRFGSGGKSSIGRNRFKNSKETTTSLCGGIEKPFSMLEGSIPAPTINFTSLPSAKEYSLIELSTNENFKVWKSGRKKLGIVWAKMTSHPTSQLHFTEHLTAPFPPMPPVTKFSMTKRQFSSELCVLFSEICFKFWSVLISLSSKDTLPLKSPCNISIIELLAIGQGNNFSPTKRGKIDFNVKKSSSENFLNVRTIFCVILKAEKSSALSAEVIKLK
mmetsp:Transcript_14442/g.21440  ORF Transcript_14442/g.21440 Transcript_14442/m.21440 type:complete len:285 (+) Transcript_14442:108-962(+)